MKLDIQRFAVTKSTSFSESNISIPNNTSTLKITITFSPNNDSTWFSSETLNCTCNGVKQTKKVSLSKGGSVSATFTFNNIKHNNDGTKSVSWSWNCNTGTSVLGNISDSGTRTLTKIPRASGISFSPSPATLGQALTISLTKYIEGTTDTLSFQIGNISGTITTTDEDMYIWTPPLELAEAMPNSTSGICVISCTSYDGDTLIGTSTANLTLEVPSSIKPTGSIISVSEADETMIDLNWGIFVQNKSKLHIVLDVNGSYGSEIVYVHTTFTEYPYMIDGTDVITNAIPTSGPLHMVVNIKDSRGRFAYLYETITIEPYSNPIITSVEAQRCLQDGTLDEDGTYLKYTFVGSISPVANNNDALFKIGYKKTTDENYTYVDIEQDYTINDEDEVSTFTISSDYAYNIVFEAVDSFMTTAIGRDLLVGFDIMNFNANGKAMAIGKVSEAGVNEELLEIDLPTQFLQSANFDSITIDNEPILIIEEYQEYTGAIASGSSATITFDITKSGYTPIGIMGVMCDGTRASFVNIFQYFITSSISAEVHIRNTHSSSALVVNETYIKIYVAYIKQ